MSALVKAILEEITSDARGSTAGNPVEVQFNPTSLGLALTNKTDEGRAKGRQTKQYMGKTSTELTLELVFDTADEGTPEAPRSVREKTAMVERFVLPLAGGKQAPPKLRFRWDRLIIEGLVESVHIDFDLFAANGTPLRAKVKLTLKEQDAKYELVPASPGALAGPPPPGGGKLAAPGARRGVKPADRSAAALGGETPVDFAVRVGLDPAAWRGLEVDLGASLTLEAGVSVGFRADLDVDVGLGVHTGVFAGADISLEASLGLQGSDGGLALVAAGGVDAALRTAAAVHQRVATAATRAAFAADPTPHTDDEPAPVRRTPLRIGGFTATAGHKVQAPLPDPRATAFGRGVPLRDRFRLDLGGSPELPGDSTRPPWEQLPTRRMNKAGSAPLVTACRCKGSCCCQGGY